MVWSVEIIHIDLTTDGDATLILIKDTANAANNRNILIDGGMSKCARLIVDELEARAGAAARLNLAIVTHFDRDHVRGIADLAINHPAKMRGTTYRDRGETRTVSVYVDDRASPPRYFAYPNYGSSPESETYYTRTEAQRRREIRDAVAGPIWNQVRAKAKLTAVEFRDGKDFAALNSGNKSAFASIGLDVTVLGSKVNDKVVKEALITRAYDIILGHAINGTTGAAKAKLQALSKRSESKYLPNASAPLPKVRQTYDALGFVYGTRSLLGKEFIWGGSTPAGAPELTCVAENSFGLQADMKGISEERTSTGSPNHDDSENVSSLGFVLKFNKFKYYIGGDLGIYQEENIKHSLIKDIDVIKCSHHGSEKSTSINFLKKTNPVVAVISNSDNNTFGFPDLNTQIRLNCNAPALTAYFMTGFPQAWIRSAKAKVMGNGETRRGHVRILIGHAGSKATPAEFTVQGDLADAAAWTLINTRNKGVKRTTKPFGQVYKRGSSAASRGKLIDLTPVARFGYVVAGSGTTASTSSGATSSTSSRGTKRKQVRAVGGTKRPRAATAPPEPDDFDIDYDSEDESDGDF